MLVAVSVWLMPRSRPHVVLWVWERPEDVSAVDPGATGLAVLAGSFEIGPAGMRYRPRLQPVRLPEAAVTTTVFRVDVEEGTPLPVQDVASRILTAVGRRVTSVQIDFDARISERTAYRELLERLRAGLPKGASLGITALASWCLGDPWIRDLPVDEAVPMLFRMGPDAPEVRRYLEWGGDFHVPLCRSSVGLSLDEPALRVPGGLQRVYLFSPRQWDGRSLALARNVSVLR